MPNKDDASVVFSQPDYEKMKRHGVDSYVVDPTGRIFMLHKNANNRTEAVEYFGVVIEWEDIK